MFIKTRLSDPEVFQNKRVQQSFLAARECFYQSWEMD